MSKKVNNGYSRNCLVKEIKGATLYLFKGFDLVHGKGFFARIHTDDFKDGFGFHKTNKFTAVRQALKDINYKGYIARPNTYVGYVGPVHSQGHTGYRWPTGPTGYTGPNRNAEHPLTPEEYYPSIFKQS